jgi:hypothetical protein
MTKISSRTGIPAPTLKRWKREGCWPAGRAVLRPLDEFIELVKPYRGRGHPADVAILKLAGLHRIPTTGLADTLLRLMCVPEGAEDPAVGLDPGYEAYNLVTKWRRTVEGRRIFALIRDDLMDDQAPLDIAEDRADNAQSAVALALFGESDPGVDDLAQLIENQVSRLVGAEPQLASDLTLDITSEGLNDLRRELPKMLNWLATASIDDMADAVPLAVKLDEAMKLIQGGRDDRGDEEHWRGIGRMAPLAGVNPQKVIAMLEAFTALRDEGFIRVAQPTMPLTSSLTDA